MILLSETRVNHPLADSPARLTSFGLGDAAAAVATPIARALGLPCIDPATKQLRPESGCAKRKKTWNASVPDITRPFG